MSQPSAEQVITGFYRRCGAPAPAFEFGTEEDEEHRPVHACTLTLADAVWEGQPVPGDRHTASAGRRKAARCAAAEAALEALRDHPAFEAAQDAVSERVQESPLATLATMLSDEEVRRNTEVEAAVLLAQRYADGWLPLTALLAPARRTLLSQWGRRYLPTLKHDQANYLYEMRCRLAAEPPLAGGTLELGGDYSVVRRTQAYVPNASTNASAALEASLEMAARRHLAAVLLPADTSLPPTEVRLDGGAYYLDAIAAALGCEPDQVWHWGIANRNFRVLAPLDIAAAAAAGRGEYDGTAAAEWVSRTGGDSDTAETPDDLELSLCQQFGYPPPTTQPPEPDPLPEHPGLFAEAEEQPLVGLIKGLTNPQPVTAEDLAAAVADKHNEAPVPEGATSWPSRASLHPSMYSALPAIGELLQQWNARAGWITGKAVRGDVLLARVRPRPWVIKLGERRRSHPVLRASSYPLPELAAAAAACAPSQLYARHLGASLVARLPTDIRSCDAWPGRLPKALLDELSTPGVALPGAAFPLGLSDAATDEGAPSEAECGSKRKSSSSPASDYGEPVHKVAAIEGKDFAEADPVTMSASISDDGVAEQQAALQALHTLQQQHTAAWAAAFPRPGAPGTPGNQHLADPIVAATSAANSSGTAAAVPGGNRTADRGVQVLQGGRGLHRPIQPGSRVKVAYSVTADPVAGGEQLVLERHDGLTFEWEANGVLPEVEAAAAAVAMHGVARCSIEVALPAGGGCGGGCRKLLLPGTLALRLLDVAPPQPVPTPGPLFAPPAAAQRYALVASLAVAAGAKTVVDLGCGDGKLIQHLASDNAVAAEALDRVTGIDISATALVRGRKTLELDQQLAKAVGAPRPQVGLILADMCQAQPGDWGDLQGSDAAAMVEVIEHLDSGALAAAGPALLGGLRPKIAVVTTPNIEYNPVLAAAGGGQLLLHNGLRNRDHRFEWTRAQFQGWAQPLAAAHGYQVHFEGVGRLRPEILKMMQPTYANIVATEADVGCATQVALFVRQQR